MKFIQEAMLIGVVGKKATGTLDDGKLWSTDRVELHVLTPFPDTDTMAHGNTVTCFAVQNYAENYDRAKSMIDQIIVLHMEMVPAKKLGQPSSFACRSFELAHVNSLPKTSRHHDSLSVVSTGSQALALEPTAASKIPEGVKTFK